MQVAFHPIINSPLKPVKTHFEDVNGHGLSFKWILLFIYGFRLFSITHIKLESRAYDRGLQAKSISYFYFPSFLRRFIKHRTIAQRHEDVIQTINPSELLFNKERNVDALSSFMVVEDENINGRIIYESLRST